MLCPVCTTFSTNSAAVVRDVGGSSKTFYFTHCGVCDANFDHRIEAVNESENDEAQALVNAVFYKPSFSKTEFDKLLKINENMIAGFTRFCRLRDVYIEIGVGLGFLTRAAASSFGRVYGLDLEVDTAESIGPKAGNVEFRQHQKFLETVDFEISALCAWHVIEHFPNPQKVLLPLVARLSTKGVVFGQVPLFKSDYVCDAHFVFYSERTMITLFAQFGLYPVLLERDETNDFLTFCFRKA
jgi:hypothetical protein